MASRAAQPLSERAMSTAERRFPKLAAQSGHQAYKKTLSQTGAVVVKTSNGQLIERRSDGSSAIIKHLPVGKRVKTGAVLTRAK